MQRSNKPNKTTRGSERRSTLKKSLTEPTLLEITDYALIRLKTADGPGFELPTVTSLLDVLIYIFVDDMPFVTARFLFLR